MILFVIMIVDCLLLIFNGFDSYSKKPLNMLEAAEAVNKFLPE